MANRELADLNSATIGAKMPEVTLADGTVVQTGTVGALLLNIKSYNKAHAAGQQEETERLAAAIELSVPLLKKVGLFELFAPDEWLRGDNEGRKVVGRRARELGVM